ncbi:hypothetical protein [Streptomyces decoyicus]|uniref:hypothetical protein n=1 Tax=Streptomyces decoyicus TaxID=249567 RepID=UPI00386A0C66|nr:hypothetical protein OG532_13795 [Streptomyces decoyicus]
MFEGAEAVRAVGAVRRAAHLFPHPEDTSPAALGGEGEGLADPQARAGLQVDRQPVVRLDVPGDEVDLFPGRDRVLVDRTATDPWEFGTVHRAPGDAPFVHRGLEQVADQRHEVVHRARRRLGTEGGDEPVDVRPLHAGERLAAQLRQEVEAQEAVVVAVGVLPDQPTLQPVRGVCADGDGTALGVQEESLVLKVLGPRGELPGLGLHREAHLALTARLSPRLPVPDRPRVPAARLLTRIVLAALVGPATLEHRGHTPVSAVAGLGLKYGVDASVPLRAMR